MASGTFWREQQHGVEPLAIIPVIDLQHGLVVRARAGERAGYRPIETPLAPSPDPVAVATGLLATTGATRLYLADLDAIAGREANDDALRRIAAAHPGVELWVDAGFAHERSLAAFLDAALGRPVLGTESQSDAALLARYRGGVVLSLDSRGGLRLGPDELHEDPTLWPRDVIVMTLSRIGIGAGPDFAALAAIKTRAPQVNVYAAGGLRGPEDLAPLHQAGASGALVASAIHDGRLRREHLG